MRCSTVSGLLLVAAWAAGGLPVVLLLWAAAGSAPARAMPPTRAAAASVRVTEIMKSPFLEKSAGKERAAVGAGCAVYCGSKVKEARKRSIAGSFSWPGGAKQ